MTFKKTPKNSMGLEPLPQQVYDLLGHSPGSKDTADQTCETCRFVEENKPDVWVCRKAAPIPYKASDGGLITLWPRIRLTDWCGDWRDQSKALNAWAPKVLEYEKKARSLHAEEQAKAERAERLRKLERASKGGS